MEQIIKTFIYIHAALGTIGLLAGLMIFVTKKGTSLHKKLGNVFYFSLLVGSAIALVVCNLPGHKNPFLFLIGLFTVYMVLTGKRALTFKPKMKTKTSRVDYLITFSMLAIALCMIVFGIRGYINKMANNGVLFFFFGILALMLSIQDLKMYRTFMHRKNVWLLSHIGKMSGAMIASVTAFMVGGMKLRGLEYWIFPTIIGIVYIYYHIRKIKNKGLISLPQQ
ncbi:DUF2306 domain-containing protein [Gynurincola endophyticus]|uniref:hypothetical protein n=1 Tax=Gynurincola endophyticus TaxID=2479004 RepID=UPI000F8E2F58|nr:hypothetical protein [Gynurincola endophyticus]